MYKESKPAHCGSCPSNSAADPNNPKACVWEDLEVFPEGRRKVIQIVQQLMKNNPHPWCGFDRKFRAIVVRSAARAVMGCKHGNEENYHASENQPANFRRRRLSETGYAGIGSSQAKAGSPINNLARAAAAREAAVRPTTEQYVSWLSVAFKLQNSLTEGAEPCHSTTSDSSKTQASGQCTPYYHSSGDQQSRAGGQITEP